MYYDRPEKRKTPRAKPAPKKAAPKRTAKAAPPKPAPKKRPVKKDTRVRTAVYERKQKKTVKPVRRENTARHPLRKLLCLLLLLLIAVPVILYFVPQKSLSNRSPASFGAINTLPEGCTHVLLIGLDKNGTASSRSDTMIIASVGRDGVWLTSLMRDTGVTIPGYSGTHRLNAAYSYGGADLLLKTINGNFGFDLTSYIAVDYESFPPLIDILGGVDIASVSAAEVKEINNNVYDVLRRRYDAGQYTKEEAAQLYEKEKLDGSGNLHLDGLQALGYARIRKTDSDYGRTNRQRKVLSAAFTKLKSSAARPLRLLRFVNKGLHSIETNMSVFELISLGEKALFTGSIAQLRLPADGTFKDDGGMFYNVDYKANYKRFIEFVYGK